MLSLLFESPRMRGVAIALGALVAFLPGSAFGATLLSYAIDPTSTSVYYSFTSDAAVDAYRGVVRQAGTTTVVRAAGRDPVLPVFSGVRSVAPLSPGSYEIDFYVKWQGTSTFVKLRTDTFSIP